MLDINLVLAKEVQDGDSFQPLCISGYLETRTHITLGTQGTLSSNTNFTQLREKLEKILWGRKFDCKFDAFRIKIIIPEPYINDAMESM